MKWHLLNQHFVHLESEDYHVSVLEEALSSELQLVQVLASGLVSYQTMRLHSSQKPELVLLENRTLELT